VVRNKIKLIKNRNFLYIIAQSLSLQFTSEIVVARNNFWGRS